MPALPYTLQSTTGDAFRANGERAHLLAWLQRHCPHLTQSVRVGIARMLERGLDALGRDALNTAITDLDGFEQRLAVTPLRAHGYPSYFKLRLRWAARFLHAAGHEADGDYLQGLLRRSSPSTAAAERAGVAAFPIASGGNRRPGAARRTANDNDNDSRRTPARDDGQQPAGNRALEAADQNGARPGPLEKLERVIVRHIEMFDSVPVDRTLVQHIVPVCMRPVRTEDKVTLVRVVADDLARQLKEAGGTDQRATVDAIAEQLIAQILYPRVEARVCSSGDRDHGNQP